MNSERPAPVLTECARCEASGLVEGARLTADTADSLGDCIEERCPACKGAGEVAALCGCCDEPATELSLGGHPLCEKCATAIDSAASAILHAVRTPPPPPPGAWADVAVVRILAAARLWLPAARLELRLEASVRLARAGVRRFPRAANRVGA